jgi:DNA-directed RNA polymerase subunit beta
MCPIETPEGPNIGLIGSLATFGRVNAFGFVETPYRKVTDGEVTDQVDYLTADEEDKHVIAQANALDASGSFAASRVLVRKKGGEVDYIDPSGVDYIDVSPRQICSVATAMIPFLEHDDANRALMGSNMMRQAVPLLRSESPLVGTGMEHRAAVDAGDVIVAEQAGLVEELSADYITVMHDDGTRRTYRLLKFRRSNQGTCVNQKPIVEEGARVEAGQVLADGPCTDQAEMALGKNLLVAFMSWEGHNYEDAIILSSGSSRTTCSPRSTSTSTRSTPATPSWAPRRSPGTSRTSPRRCSPTSTSAGSSASAPRSCPVTSWSARSRPRARPS